jgi:hypothetical protein
LLSCPHDKKSILPDIPLNIGDINVRRKPYELYALIVKAVQIAPELKIIQGNEEALKLRISILNKDLSESSYDIAIKFKGNYSIARMTPLNLGDWNRISAHRKALVTALTRYSLY